VDPKVYTKYHLLGKDGMELPSKGSDATLLLQSQGHVGWMEFSAFSVLYQTRGFGMYSHIQNDYLGTSFV